MVFTAESKSIVKFSAQSSIRRIKGDGSVLTNIFMKDLYAGSQWDCQGNYKSGEDNANNFSSATVLSHPAVLFLL
jgi:hypothetical protein